MHGATQHISPQQAHDQADCRERRAFLQDLKSHLVVSSTERRVALWRRDGPRWVVETFIGEAELRLEAIDAAIPLAAIYAGTAV